MIALDRIALERRIVEERMLSRDPRDEPPLIDGGARVEVMDAAGIVQPWTWADSVRWWEVVAWRGADDGTNGICSCCEMRTVDMRVKSEAATMICADCWEHGDFDDGNAE